MDKSEQKANRWAWLPAQMPRVAQLLREKRERHGDAYVNECWRRGVLQGEPGWFFAVEGAIAVGTPSPDERLAWFASLGPRWVDGKGSKRAEAFTPGQALLVMRNPEEVGHGAR